jgi:outer membrane lipoprotein-sorting protein
MKNIFFTRLFMLIIASSFVSGGVRAAPNNLAILKQADEARGNLQGTVWEVTVESTESQRTVDTMTWNIKSRDFDISGLTLAPPRSKGNRLLMTNNNMWFYKPGLSKPIPIAQRQKLIGTAAYGDIASTNYAEDYESSALSDEPVNGEDCFVYDLKSRNDKTTYDKIKYWISKKRIVGVKAEYYTVSGKKFKLADMEYKNTVNINGNIKPFISKMIIRDALLNENITYLSMNKPKFELLPDYIFNLNLFMK